VPFVPDDFEVPLELDGPGFRLEPLGPEHNESDHVAWMSSIEHVRATPGFGTWPPQAGMSLDANLSDLKRHAREFTERTRFAYTVLEGDRVIGCVYVSPVKDDPAAASVKSWVTADRAHLDGPLHDTVSAWLARAWPFERVAYRSQI